MAEADEPARPHGIEKGLGGGSSGRIIEVNQQVATEDHVDIVVFHRIERVEQVDPREIDQAGDIRIDLVAAARKAREILLQECRRQVLDGARAEDAGRRRLQHFRIDVGRQYLDIEVVQFRPLLKQVDDDRIGFFPVEHGRDQMRIG